MTGNSQMPAFRKPSLAEAFLNRTLGLLVGLGIGPKYMRLLQVRGRKTGRIYSTPVNLLDFGGRSILVAPRGQTQWVRNAEAAGEITLKRGGVRNRYRLRTVPDGDKPKILKLYLEKYKSQVQRYFPVPAGSPAEHFSSIAMHYPAFELVPA
jgi:deazaflavin-dependent oxidoreductase (nitroreductase family)